MKLLETIYAFIIMSLCLRVFRPEKVFKGKRVAVIGAADSLFKEKNGNFIDDFDIVIRINKAAAVWNNDTTEYTGEKFTLLFHSFYENNFSGGGPINFKKFDDLGIQKIIHPNINFKGVRTHLSFYKRHLKFKITYVFPIAVNQKIIRQLKGFIPTVGFSALYSVLTSECEEVFITGFTFFRTPYAEGYRNDLRDRKTNALHIKNQGVHNPEIEFQVFKSILRKSPAQKIILDSTLQKLIDK